MSESVSHYKGRFSKRQFAGSLITIVAAAVLVIALIWTNEGPEAKLEDLPPLKVVLVEIKRQDVTPVETVVGRLQPIRTTQLKFEVQGRVRERLVEPGMSVAGGQALLRLNEDDLRDQFIQAESQYHIEQAGIRRDQRMLELAKDNLALQQVEVRRLEQLSHDSLVSVSHLDAARRQVLSLDSTVSELQYNVATAQTRLALKKSRRDVARRNLERATLSAPFKGHVNQVKVHVGDYVAATEVVATIVDVSSLDLQLDVRSRVAAALVLGQEIIVHVGTQLIYGKLIALQPDPDIFTNTHTLRIRLPEGNVQPGMLASAELPLVTQSDAITIPVSSVATHEDESHVYVFEDGHLRQVPIAISQRVGSEYIISSGPAPGELIVARDVSGLVNGQQVVANL